MVIPKEAKSINFMELTNALTLYILYIWCDDLKQGEFAIKNANPSDPVFERAQTNEATHNFLHIPTYLITYII